MPDEYESDDEQDEEDEDEEEPSQRKWIPMWCELHLEYMTVCENFNSSSELKLYSKTKKNKKK